MNAHDIDATLAAAGSKATLVGAGASVASWLTSSEFGVLAGLVLGIAGLLVNWFFRRRSDKREQAYHDARMRNLERSSDV